MFVGPNNTQCFRAIVDITPLERGNSLGPFYKHLAPDGAESRRAQYLNQTITKPSQLLDLPGFGKYIRNFGPHDKPP